MATLRYVNDLGNGHSGYIDYGSGIPVSTISGQSLNVSTASGDSVSIQPAGAAGDAFGRLRISEPFTLFDSSHRFSINGNWYSSTAVSGAVTFNMEEILDTHQLTGKKLRPKQGI